MRIYNLDIDTSTLSASGETRSLNIRSDIGASYDVMIVRSDSNFYNFRNQTFQAGFNNNTIIKVKSAQSNNRSTTIKFPTTTSVTYNAILIPKNGTTLFNNKALFNKSISTAADSTLTFAVGTTNTANYSSSPASANVTSDGSSTLSSSGKRVSCAYTVNNASTDAGGFGLRFDVPSTIDKDNHWYFETTETVDGATSSSTTVVVDDVTDLFVGMEMKFKTGTTAAAAGTTITAIDTATKTLTLSVANSLSDGATMTFRLYGLKSISSALNCRIQSRSATLTPLSAGRVSTAVRGTVSNSTTITCTTTKGISGGSVLTFGGSGVDNSSTNNVNVVTPDPDGSDADGQFTCDVAQTLSAGTVIRFDSLSISTSLSILVELEVFKYPTANRTIKLDLDKFITPGTAS